MRVLLDECIPRRLKYGITGHEVVTVPEMGWAGKRNGELLSLAAKDFDVFVTADQNLQYQQNLADFDIAVALFVAPTNRYMDLKPLIPSLLSAFKSITPGKIIIIQ